MTPSTCKRLLIGGGGAVGLHLVPGHGRQPARPPVPNLPILVPNIPGLFGR
jgi:hypothetical protein